MPLKLGYKTDWETRTDRGRGTNRDRKALRTVAIIQARMSSQRCPGKVLADMGDGHTLLWHVVTRVKRAKLVDCVVVATGDIPANAPIRDLCAVESWSCHSGSEDDVLDRFYQAATWLKADVIVRITGDCPLVSASEIDAVIQFRQLYKYQYAANCFPPTLCDGLDCEAFTFNALEAAQRNAFLRSDREHVTPWLRRELPREVWGSLAMPGDYAKWRLCVDEQADLDVMRELFRLGGPGLDWRKAVRLLAAHPELAAKNQRITRNEGYAKSLAADHG